MAPEKTVNRHIQVKIVGLLHETTKDVLDCKKERKVLINTVSD
jgi:hypothetical protein